MDATENDANENIEDRIDRLVAWYGSGEDGSTPRRAQWRSLLARPQDRPVTFVNFFKLRETALYRDGEAGGSGEEAFKRYADVSIPTVEAVGGRFLFVGPFESGFIGAAEDWDLVAIGTFPTAAHFLALVEHPDYVACYPHRTAACAHQKTAMCGE